MSKLAITNSLPTAAGVGCVTLFGVPFAAVGLAMAGYVIWIIAGAIEMRGWEAVPVTILESTLESHHSDDGTTYSVSAQYGYDVDGRHYTGTRVNLGLGSDNLGSYHERMHARLDAARRSGRTITGYYNPDNPSESILDRNPRLIQLAFLLIFVGTFTPVGCGLVAAGGYGGRKLMEEEGLKRQYPDAPWKWRPDWAAGQVTSGGGKAPRVWAGVAVLWLLMTLPLFWFAAEHLLQSRPMDALPAAPYLVVDLVLLYFAGRSIGRARRYGMATLTLNPMPAPVGGTLSGELHTEGALPFQDDLVLHVSCERVRTEKTGKGTSTRRDELWQGEHRVEAAEIDRRGGGSRAAFNLPLPADLPEAGSENPRSKIEWTLKAECTTRGYDFKASFPLPIFGVAAPDSGSETEGVATVQAEALVLDPKVVDVRETASGGLSFHFPRGRFLSASVMMIVFILIFGGATVALFLAEDAPLMLRGSFAFSVFIMVLITVQMLTGSTRTDIDNGEIRIRRVVLLRRKEQRYTRDAVASITIRQGMRVNERQFYDIVVKLNSGKSVKAGTSIPGTRQAEQIALLMEEALRQ